MKNPERHKAYFIILTFTLGWLFATSQTKAAPLNHPAPSVLKDYILTMTSNELQIYSYLRVSPELVPEVYRQIDLNGDDTTSESERQNWIKEHLSKISVTLDDNPLPLEIEQVPSVSKQDLLASIDHPIKVNYMGKLAAPASGKHRIRFTYGDNYLPYDEYYLSVAGDTVNDSRSISIAQPNYPATYQVVYMLPDMGQNVPEGELAPAPFTASTTPTPASDSATQGSGPFGWVTAMRDQLRDTLGNWNGEIWSALGLFLFALVLGGLHALTPGHGKAMVAAYLVGSRGRVRDAITLGWVVTATHTAVVFAFGLAIAFISNFVVPRALYPTLELIAGLLVASLGAYLLLNRIRELRARNRPRYLHASNGHKQAQAAVAKQSKTLVQVGAAQGGAALPVRTASGAAQSKSADNGNGHDHGHEHTKNTGTLYGHSHDGRYHVHVNPNATRPLSRRGLVGLGIAGGLVPCSDAIAILFVAGVGRIWLGMGLVTAFSLGLAAVLIIIGVVLVKMKGRMDMKLVSNPFWTYWIPVISACIVLLMGLFIVFAALGSSWA
jgi:nickel/cobalt transporter (NicO) family protein